MPRYVAFLRGVSPMNAKMADLKKCFEKLGYQDVRTVLSSGNVVFTAASKSENNLAKSLEVGMAEHLPRSFPVIVRKIDHLLGMLKIDPYASFRISPKAKRVVTFLNKPYKGALTLPIEVDDVRILCMKDADIFTAYIPNERGPVFMALIEKTFGKGVTTRTWDTIKKCTAV